MKQTTKRSLKDYMIYCKAKRIYAQEERRELRKFRWYQKMGCELAYYGGKSYPWSRLYHCRCGNKYPWMHGFPSRPPYNEMVREGARYRVVCHRCFRHTKKGSYQEVVEEWNTRIGIDYIRVIEAWEGSCLVTTDLNGCIHFPSYEIKDPRDIFRMGNLEEWNQNICRELGMDYKKIVEEMKELLPAVQSKFFKMNQLKSEL